MIHKARGRTSINQLIAGIREYMIELAGTAKFWVQILVRKRFFFRAVAYLSSPLISRYITSATQLIYSQ
jgi:hypothetical protein